MKFARSMFAAGIAVAALGASSPALASQDSPKAGAESAAAAALGIHGNAGGAQLIDVAMDRAHRNFEFGGELARADAAACLQQHQDRKQAAGKHVGTLAEYMTSDGIYVMEDGRT